MHTPSLASWRPCSLRTVEATRGETTRIARLWPGRQGASNAHKLRHPRKNRGKL
jgi:hypothetical protein